MMQNPEVTFYDLEMPEVPEPSVYLDRDREALMCSTFQESDLANSITAYITVWPTPETPSHKLFQLEDSCNGQEKN